MFTLVQFKSAVLATVLAVVLIILPGVAQAATPCPSGPGVQGSSKNQVLGGLGETTTDCSGNQVQTVISAVVKILGWVAGLLGIIMIVVSGFKYITSGGDSGKVNSARSTMVYALIGLAIAVLAQVLVHFVINTSNAAITPCSTAQPTIPKSDPTCKKP